MFDEEDKKAAEAAKAEAEAARAEATQAKADAEAARAEAARANEDLKKEKAKEKNFRRLEQMTEEEKEKFTEKELELQKRQEQAEDEIKTQREALRTDWRSSAIERYARGDAEKAKAIEDALKDVAGEDTDRVAIESRVAKAAKLARKDAEPDHVGRAMTFGGEAPAKEEKKPDYTDHGKRLEGLLGLK